VVAYYVKTTAEFYSDSGYLSTQAGVPKGRTEEAVKIILSEYRRIASEDVSTEELARAKDVISGRLLMRLEASDEVASWYGRQAVLREHLSDPDEVEKKLRSLKVSDIRQAARMIVKNNGLNLAIIGQISSSEKKNLQAALKL